MFFIIPIRYSYLASLFRLFRIELTPYDEKIEVDILKKKRHNINITLTQIIR